ncbi:TonB-dependent receptor [Sandaracinobacter sp. RS1-74]|uniref:TonB-dependent receptor n=1 Tax=Sandaracinobacteroides sayramensis TaxID=2913411 RepID=UPI001EDA64ED|nr:TonB-dependent receptor [Sandaracinobacteroides sayramensis]MCG2842162.1 TonB-dependent receptor [Sandaracinobacteroides sayramensis]
MNASKLAIRAALISAVSVQGLTGFAAAAQTAGGESGVEDIIVTAQRQAQSLQDVPIAVSAFSSEALQEKQINNAAQLQLSLPNVTFAKTNFTGSSFTIRGIGDLCVGVTCDAATGIHMNDLPLSASRISEVEYFDMERIEVLRGPQGTLFGRNATSGVVNFVTAKPRLGEFGASGEATYGNYNEIRLQGMVNVPLGDRVAARIAGFYLNRDGMTENLYDDSRIDGRDMYALRGSLLFEPGDDTSISLMGYYFREKDDRLRIQKQMCQRDPTGVLGCLPGSRQFGTTNGNSTIASILSSRELLRINGGAGLGAALSALGLGSLYGPDVFANVTPLTDPRQVSTDYTPRYFAEEIILQGKIEHDFGAVRAKLSGQWQSSKVDSSQDYNLSVQNGAGFATGLGTLAAYASGAFGPALQQFANVQKILSNGNYCTSLAEPTGTGAYAGHSLCSATPQDFDRSNQDQTAWTVEGIVSSQFDGPFNFLVGAIYNNVTLTENSYYVNSFGLDYASGVLGVATAIGQQAAGNTAFPATFMATPMYRNNSDHFTLKSWGLFGEAYYEINDTLKLTVGLRYNDDRKFIRARNTLLSFPAPFGVADAFDSPFVGNFDADPGLPGTQLWQERSVHFSEFTGRAVVDWNITDDNMVYASYSRGYKSGGINPPLAPVFEVSDSFAPEFVDAFEIGSKNRFMDGTLQLNLTGFYYKYKGLQLSRIVARTSVNDNVNANIYGVEAEAIARPIPPLAMNISFSWLNAKVSQDKYLANSRDPSGGRGDAVIIKDITNGSNCAVVPKVTGSNAAATHVTVVNSVISGENPGLLRGPAAFPSDSGLAPGTLGAYSICAQLANAAFPTAAAVDVLSAGVEVNINGNKLPQAPDFKVSTGVQWTQEFASGMTLVPRFDLNFVGQSYGNIFNGNANRIPSYVVMNAQVQLNAADGRWFVRGYIQNIADNNAVNGLYVTDASSGLFTNIFTLEPRRFGATLGFNF